MDELTPSLVEDYKDMSLGDLENSLLMYLTGSAETPAEGADQETIREINQKNTDAYDLAKPAITRLCEEDEVKFERIIRKVKDKYGHLLPSLRKYFKARVFDARSQANTANAAASPPRIKGTIEDYKSTDHGFIWLQETRGGTREILVSNFTARVTAETTEDDGIDPRRTFDIAVTQHQRVVTVRVPWEKFSAVHWAVEALGADASIGAGPLAREHVRFATQGFSSNIRKQTVYTHLGWRKIDGHWLYLHAAGALGAVGLVDGIEVTVPDKLLPYELPAPPTEDTLRQAIRASLGLLDVAPIRVTAPVYCSIWRAVLGGSDFSIHMSGETGEGKTAVALLALNHLGARFNYLTVPGAWETTANSNEALAFIAKDALFLVDDFVTGGSVGDIQRKHREADRLLRSQANQSGRGRMRSDTTLRAAKPPRGLILSTGEDIPKGHSLRARMLIVEVPKGAVNFTTLSQYQADAASGLYAQAMAGFIQWIAPQYETIRTQLKTNIEAWRLQVNSEHKKTNTIVASLAAGFEMFLSFACEVRAITEEERATYWQRVWNALLDSSDAQAAHHGESDPARRFIDLLIAALSSGRAHLVGTDGKAPTDPTVWGWKATDLTNGIRLDPQGVKVGWIDKVDVYLDPDESYAMVQRFMSDQKETMPITAQILRKRLKEKGYLASVETTQETVTIRKTLEGKTRHVIHILSRILVEGLYTRTKPVKPVNNPESAPENQSDSEKEPENPSKKTENPSEEITRQQNLSTETHTNSDTYHIFDGFDGFSTGLESTHVDTPEGGILEGENVDGFDGSLQKENPSTAKENPSFDLDASKTTEAEEEEWER